jgi:hypothetical protein
LLIEKLNRVQEAGRLKESVEVALDTILMAVHGAASFLIWPQSKKRAQAVSKLRAAVFAQLVR